MVMLMGSRTSSVLFEHRMSDECALFLLGIATIKKA